MTVKKKVTKRTSIKSKNVKRRNPNRFEFELKLEQLLDKSVTIKCTGSQFIFISKGILLNNGILSWKVIDHNSKISFNVFTIKSIDGNIITLDPTT